MKRRIILIVTGIMMLLLITACAKEKEALLDHTPAENVIDLSSGFEQGKADEFQKVLENDRFLLSANLSKGDISLLDKAGGKTWYSNPIDKEDDFIATGYNKISLFSQVLVTYATNQSVIMNTGSFMGSVSKSGLTYRIDDDSIIFKYDFVKENIVVPVRYSITDTEFTAEILTTGLQETGTNQIMTIDLLPFFGAGSLEDDGYLLVPDGSGALIYFNNGKTNAKEFEKNLYGFDNGTNDMLLNTDTAIRTTFTVSDNVYLPVFGEKCNEDGFLAIITGQKARASVKARSSGNYTSYNNVWSTYGYRTSGTVRLVQKDMDRVAATIPEENPDVSENFKVSYRFLPSGKAEYHDMAKAYREYLIQEEGLAAKTKDGDIPFYLDLYGYIIKTKAPIGIPKDTLIVTSSIEDSTNLVEQLNQSGINNVVLKYNYWMKNGYYKTIQTNAKVERKLGSLKDLQSLNQLLESKGGSLYPATELVNVYKTGKGVSKFNDTLDSIANTPQVQYKFSLDSALPDSKYKSWYLIKPSLLSKYFNQFLDNFDKTGLNNVAFESIGTMAYSELSSNGTSRTVIPEQNGKILRDALSKVDNIMLSGANDYSAVSATHILNTPVKGSNYDVEDADVPFYQLVFHGYNYYSLGATNLTSNPEEMLLKCLEYGAAPMYSWVSRNSEELIGSKTDHLYSADYTKWIEYAIQEYTELNDVLKNTSSTEITSHRILQEGVRETVYGDSIRVIVNYNSTDETIEGNLIPAKDYLVLGEAK